MMFVIWWTTQRKYYTYNPNNHWSSDIAGAATFKSLTTATNHAKTALKDKLNELEYIEAGSKPFSELLESAPGMTKEEAEAAYEELQKAVEIFGQAAEKIPAIMKYYNTVQDEQNKLQEDLLHKFEFTSPNNILFVKLGRMLHNCRLKRREAKDRNGYMIALSNAKALDILSVHNGHKDLLANRVYAPRIANELFEKGSD